MVVPPGPQAQQRRYQSQPPSRKYGIHEIDPVALSAMCYVLLLAMHCLWLSGACCVLLSLVVYAKLQTLRNTVLSAVHCGWLPTVSIAVDTSFHAF